VPEEGGALQNDAKDAEGNISLPLIDKKTITDDTFIFRFGFEKKDEVFGLPIGKHVVFTAEIDGEECQRKYTPISRITQRGYIDFLIKIYRANVHPRFP
jgi:NAD(P)H-flavin reductase